MKRLDIDGLKYYTSRLLNKIKSFIVGFTPTVQVRPADMTPVSENITLGLGANRMGPDILSSISAEIRSDKLRFVIHCDSEESAKQLCQLGEYALRFSYLSRRYDTPKWVCPSRNKNNLSDGRWYIGTTWEETPIDSSCSQSKSYITIETGNSVRDMMLDILDKEAPSEIKNNLSDDEISTLVHPFMLENAVIFGSNTWTIRASKVIKKRALMKGVLEYLSDTELEITPLTVCEAPSNAYSIPIKVSIWKGDLELPGGSIGVLSFHKKRTTGHSFIFVYRYKETNKR